MPQQNDAGFSHFCFLWYCRLPFLWVRRYHWKTLSKILLLRTSLNGLEKWARPTHPGSLGYTFIRWGQESYPEVVGISQGRKFDQMCEEVWAVKAKIKYHVIRKIKKTTTILKKAAFLPLFLESLTFNYSTAYFGLWNRDNILYSGATGWGAQLSFPGSQGEASHQQPVSRD